MALDDTAENQAEYPQPTSQKPGCGFPVMSIMGVLNHAHGGWEDFVEGEQSAHDSPIFHKLLHCFEAGDILCGDRAFCTYELMATLHSRDVDTVMRLHQARHRVLNKAQGQKDRQEPASGHLAKARPATLRQHPERGGMGGAPRGDGNPPDSL